MSLIAEFLEALHPQRLRGNDFIEMRAFDKQKGRERREFFTDLASAETWAVQLYGEFDVYVGVCPRPVRSGKNENIERSYYVWADVDADKVKRTGQPLLNMIMGKLALLPTIIVESGSGGVHVYYEIESENNLGRIQEINNKIAERIHPNCDKLGDPARILRVAGTLNHKSEPPTPVQLIHYQPHFKYKLTDIEAMLRLSNDVALRIHSGSSDGYPSDSERDFAVIGALVRAGMSDVAIEHIFDNRRVGNKAAESPNGHYLQFTLDKMRKDEGLDEGEVSPIYAANAWGIIESKNAYHAVLGNGDLRALSTFVFEPEVLLEGNKNEPDTLMGTVRAGDGVWPNVALSRRAFNRTDTLIAALPKAQWQFFGKDGDVKRLLPYLIDKLLEKGEGKIPTRKAVSAFGRYGNLMVLPEQTLNENGVVPEQQSDIVWLNTNREHPKIAVTEYPEEQIEEAVHEFCSLYFKINEPAVTYPALGWYVSTLFKTIFEARGIRFPILNFFGTRGSGKTTLITNVLQPLVGYVEPKTYDANTTNFVLLSLLGSSNSFPVSFSEYRRASLRNPESLIRFILLSYDNGSDSRGRSDQTTVEYPLIAPFTVDGEDAIGDAACLERTIQLNMHPESIRENTEAYANFQALLSVNLEAVAFALLRWSLSYEPDFETSFAAIRNNFTSELPDRVRRNLGVVLAGLFAFNDFAITYGVEPLSIPVREILEPALTSVVSEITGRTKLMADEFVEDIVNFIQVSAKEDFVYKYIEETNILYINITGAHRWWLSRRRQQNLPVLDSAAIKNQLRERLVIENSIPQPGNYIVSIGTRSINGASTYAYGINLQAAQSTGLDIPNKITRFTPVLRSSINKIDVNNLEGE